MAIMIPGASSLHGSTITSAKARRDGESIGSYNFSVEVTWVISCSILLVQWSHMAIPNLNRDLESRELGTTDQ